MWLFLILGLVAFFIIFILFFYRGKDLVINQKGIYTGRAGHFLWKEIEDVYIKDMQTMFFKKQKCIIFDLGINMYEAPAFADWRVYALPTAEVAICQSDTDIPLEELLERIKSYL